MVSVDSDFLAQIQNAADSGKGARQKVAAYLQAHTQEVAFMTIDALAERIQVSPGTITKAMQSMGFAGFSDVQERIRQAVRSSITPADRMGISADRSHTVTDSIRQDMENMERLLSRSNVDSFIPAARLLAEAPSVYVMGTRSSHAASSFLSLNLSQIRRSVYCVGSPSGSHLDELARMYRGDAFVVISLPRYHRDTLFMAREAWERGCRTIAITDSPFSPLVPLAEHSIFAPCESISFFNSYVSTFAIINALVTEAAGHSKARSMEELANINAIHKKYNTFV